MRKKKKDLQISVGNPLVLGIFVVNDGVNIALYDAKEAACEVVLFQTGTRKEVYRIPFRNEMIFGHVKAMFVKGMEPGQYDYAFCVDGEITTDPYAKMIRGTQVWGVRPEEPVICGIPNRDFDWEGDTPLRHSYEDTIIYRLHVRGFTKDSTAKVKKKGTFRGIIERIPYLKELGITMIELMPAYDFREMPPIQRENPYAGIGKTEERINFWGYAPGNYFVPKASYAADYNHPDIEFCEMVKELHRNGIEISMEFYFLPEISPSYIIACLHSWVLNYHLDGLHVSADEIVMRILEQDPILAHTKLMGWGMNGKSEDKKQNCHVAVYNSSFITHARQYLKGDEGQTSVMAEFIRNQPKEKAVINYIANHGTFTLYDTVSYDRKHNEENGEQNRDGEDYNYSWNCGEEGPSKKKRVQTLRLRQIKNALCMVFLSQGVPMLYAGDEYGNSQGGNNNPYCQDNPTGWVNWKQNKFNKEIFEFVKRLIAFRKRHPILHMRRQMELSDYKAFGLPDMSFHSNTPWYADFNHVNRHFGILFCGRYAETEGKKSQGDIYIAWNMHWETQWFRLPGATGYKPWSVAFSTGEQTEVGEESELIVPPRTVVVLTAG